MPMVMCYKCASTFYVRDGTAEAANLAKRPVGIAYWCPQNHEQYFLLDETPAVRQAVTVAAITGTPPPAGFTTAPKHSK